MTPEAKDRWRFRPASIRRCSTLGCGKTAGASDDHGRVYCVTCFAARAAWGLV